VLNHMRQTGTSVFTPTLRASDANMPRRPWIDDFSSGYMQRMMPMLPKQGDRQPWVNTQKYTADRKLLGKASIDDGVLEFSNPAALDAAPSAPNPGRSGITSGV